MKKIFLLTLFVFFAAFKSHTQQYTFSPISAQSSLPQKYIYDFIQDESGFMWIGTGEGLCRYDGHEIKTYIGKNVLAENFCARLFQSSNGNIWIGHNQGGITVKTARGFKIMRVADGSTGPAVGFAEPVKGCVAAIFAQGKLVMLRNDKTVTYNIGGNNDCQVYAFTEHARTLVLLTSCGQYRVSFTRNGTPYIQLITATAPDEKIQSLLKDRRNDGTYWAISAGGQIWQGRFKGYGALDLKPVSTPLPLENVQSMIQAPDGTFWIATFKGAQHLRYNPIVGNMHLHNHYTSLNGLPADFVKTIFIDHDQNVWFGLYGDGLVSLNDEFFTFYKYPQLSSNDIKALLVLPGETWLGTDDGILYLNHDDEAKTTLYKDGNGPGNKAVTALCAMDDKVIAGTASGGLYVFSRKTGRWQQYPVDNDNLKNQVTDLRVAPAGLWVGTRGGLVLLSRDLKPVKSWSTGTGLTHNNVNSIYVDRDESVWISVPGNKIAHIKNDITENITVTSPSQFVDISCITRDNKGRLWIGTYGSGILIKDGDSIQQLRTSNGLKSDYVYSIIFGTGNAIWAGHRGALTRIDATSLKIKSFDQKYGISEDFNTLASVMDNTGNIWFGTNRGVLRFDPAKMRPNRNPPRPVLKQVWVGDKQLDPNAEADLKYGMYKLKFSYIGISLTKQAQVRYRYMLEGFDNEWSELTAQSSVTYPRLQDGDYTFKIKAYNADGFGSKPVALYHIHISRPVWKRWWFFVIAALMLVVLIVLIIKVREENQRRMLNLLEEKLAIRTAELREKKQLVEDQNKDIMDSINYALRIQTALIPEITLLKTHLPDSFLLYRPRDIVSGDFYWYSRVGNRLLLACADCTGHGVPGAFMSMIGNTLFNEILPASDPRDPAAMLYRIDGKMHKMLQHEGGESLNDGMDMVLLSLDLETGELDFAGAIRPVLHFSGGRVEKYKTSRHSIGGPNEEKIFSNQHIKLSKGDTVYIFTDGVTDQFGGNDVRKLRIRGLVDLLGKWQQHTMEEQRFLIEDFYNKWIGSEHQLDDMLLVGFRF